MEEIIFYSKKTGVNQLLFVANDLMTGMDVIDEKHKEHKLFAYALVGNVEVKLFTSQEVKQTQVNY